MSTSVGGPQSPSSGTSAALQGAAVAFMRARSLVPSRPAAAAPAPAPRAYVDDRVRILVKHPRERSTREIDDLLEFTRSIAFFNSLPPLVHQGLVRAASVRELRAHEVVCRQGDTGDCFYIVIVGQCGVWIDQEYAANVAQVQAANAELAQEQAERAAHMQQLQLSPQGSESSATLQTDEGVRAHTHHRSSTAVVTPQAQQVAQPQPLPLPKEPTGQPLATKAKGDSFGELSLLEDQPRNATIVALVPTLLMRVDRVDYLSLLKQHHDALLREKVDFLLCVDLFANWSRADVTAVSYFFHEREFSMDALVDEHDGIIVIKEGQANLLTRSQEQSMGIDEDEAEGHAQRQGEQGRRQGDHGTSQQHASTVSDRNTDGDTATSAAGASGHASDASPSLHPSLTPAGAHLVRAVHSVMPPTFVNAANAVRHQVRVQHAASSYAATTAAGPTSTAAGASTAAAAAAAAASSSPSSPPVVPLVRATIVEHLERYSVFGENRTSRGKTHLMWCSIRYWRERALRCTSERGMRVLHISAVDFNAQVYNRNADSRRRMDLLQLRRDALSKPPFTRTPAEIDVLVSHYTSARYQSTASTAMGGGGAGVSGSGSASLLGPGMKKHAFLELLTERGRRYFFAAASIDVVNARRVVVHQDEPAELLYVLLSGSACLFAAGANSMPSSSNSQQTTGSGALSPGAASSGGGGGSSSSGGGGGNLNNASPSSSSSDLHLVNIQRGDTIGELSLLTSSPYCVTVIAATTCEFATFRRADFAHMLAAGWHPRAHMSYNFLRSMDIFSGQQQQQQRGGREATAHDAAGDLSPMGTAPPPPPAASSSSSASSVATHPQHLIRLVYAVKYLHIGVHEVLLRQGEQSDGVFFVVQGKCAVTTEVQVRKAAGGKEQAHAKETSATGTAVSATQSVHHRLHAPRIKPLEVAQLSTGEQFGEGCLFVKSGGASSHASGSTSALSHFSGSAGAGTAASSGSPPPPAPLTLGTDHRSPVTITTSTKCKLLYISAERLQLLISGRTLQRFKRMYQLKRQWRAERIRDLIANFRTVIAAPGRAPITPRAAAAYASRGGGTTAAYAAASAAIEIRPLASKQRSRILTHVASSNGSAVQQASTGYQLSSEDPASITPAPGGSVASAIGAQLSNGAEAGWFMSEINSSASGGTAAGNAASGDLSTQSAVASASAAASAYAAAAAVIPRHQWRARDKVPKDLFMPTFRPVYATTVRRAAAGAPTAAAGGAAGMAGGGGAGRLSKKSNLMRATMKMKDGGEGGGLGAALAAAIATATAAAAAGSSSTAATASTACGTDGAYHALGPSPLMLTSTSLASQRWRFALSCVSARTKLALQNRAEMRRAMHHWGGGGQSVDEHEHHDHEQLRWEFVPLRPNDDSFLPLPPTTFMGVPNDRSGVPMAPPLTVPAAKPASSDVLAGPSTVVAAAAATASTSSSSSSSTLPAPPPTSSSTSEELNDHFARILQRMSEAQSKAARVIRDNYDRPHFVKEDEEEGVEDGEQEQNASAGAGGGQEGNSTGASATMPLPSHVPPSPPSPPARRPAPQSLPRAPGDSAVLRYRQALLKSCNLPSWVHAQQPPSSGKSSLASSSSSQQQQAAKQDMFPQVPLLHPPVRQRRRVKKSWEYTSSDEEEERIRRAGGRAAAGGSDGGGGSSGSSTARLPRRVRAGVSSGALLAPLPVVSAAEKQQQLELARMKNLWAQNWSGLYEGLAAAHSHGPQGAGASLSSSDLSGGAVSSGFAAHYHGLGDVRFRDIASPVQSPNVYPYTADAGGNSRAEQEAFWASQARAQQSRGQREDVEIYIKNEQTGDMEFKEAASGSGHSSSSSRRPGTSVPLLSASNNSSGSGSQSARSAAPDLKPITPALLPVSVLAPMSKGIPPLKGSSAPSVPPVPSSRDLLSSHLSVAQRSPTAARPVYSGGGAADGSPEEVIESVVANGGVFIPASSSSSHTHVRLPAAEEPLIIKVAYKPGTTERQLRWCFEGVQVEVRRVRMQCGREGVALVEYWPLGVPVRRVKRSVYERLQRLQTAGGDVSVASSSRRPPGAGDAPRFFGLDTSSSITDRRARLLGKVAADMGVREKCHTLLAATPQLNSVHHRLDRDTLERGEHAALGAHIKHMQNGHELVNSHDVSKELSALFTPLSSSSPLRGVSSSGVANNERAAGALAMVVESGSVAAHSGTPALVSPPPSGGLSSASAVSASSASPPPPPSRPPLLSPSPSLDRRGLVSPRRASAFQHSKRAAAAAEQRQREEIRTLAVGERVQMVATREQRARSEAEMRDERERFARDEPELSDDDAYRYSDLEPEPRDEEAAAAHD